MRTLDSVEVRAVSGGQDTISGYEGAGAILTVLGTAASFTPIGAVTITIAVASAAGLAAAQFIADNDRKSAGS